jgi:hypothetical protein
MWSYRGIAGNGPAPAYLAKYAGRLVVLGGARCVWADYLELKAATAGLGAAARADLMVVNDIGVYCQLPFQHWLSLHPENLVLWRDLKRRHNEPMNCTLHTNKPNHAGMVCWSINDYGLYSGLFAAQVGVCLGYEEIILCGVPQDQSGRFFDPPWVTGLRHGIDRNAMQKWQNVVADHPELKKRVRSMSGFTKSLFGGIHDEIPERQFSNGG